ncbi:uncharacterized protein TNCV_1716761 [Trichonephila clavipes]|nr:uncharacterized protein TNCV_1716761 [Trichonephila clavipes]
MAGYQDLSEFESGVIVGARGMEHSISEVAMKFGCSRMIISRVYREYRQTGKPSNLRHRWYRKKIMQERDQRRLTRIIKRDRRATVPQIAADFNAGPSTSSTCEPFNETSSMWAFGSKGPLMYLCRLHGTKLYTSSGPFNTDIGLLMTENT